MTPTQRAVFVLGTTLAICAAYAGYLLQSGQRAPAPPAAVAAPLGSEPLTHWSFNDLDGRERHMSEWAGKLLVVNFWATWCPPCRKEIPAFITLQDRYAADGVQFVGIALDRLDAVREYAAATGMNYPVLVGETAVADYMRALGNTIGALPFSVLIARDGTILETRQGEWHEAEVEAALGAAMSALPAARVGAENTE